MSSQERKEEILRPENIVAHIKKSYGSTGELIVNLYDTFPFDPEDEDFEQQCSTEPLWVEIDSLAVPLFIKRFKRQGRSKGVILFDDFENEATAAMLLDLRLYSAEPLEDEEQEQSPYVALVGYELTDATTGVSGRVVEFLDYPSNPLLEVDFGERGVILVPVAEDLITKINNKRKRLSVKMAEGLFDLADMSAD